MRRLFHAMALAAATSLTFALPHTVHAASHANEDHCTRVTASMRICPSQRDGSYLIEQDDNHVSLFIADGKVAVLPDEGVRVRMASFPATAPMPGITATVYSDSVVEIDTLRDSQQRLSWVVRPLTTPKLPRLQVMCTGAGCSVSHILLTIE